MYDLAVQVFASGGHGQRRIDILIALVIIAVIIAGWVLYARRVRRNRRES
jgi:membrane protein DedA with SNARE-associated domain